MTPRRFPPPWSVEELDACFVVTPAVRRRACVYYENEPGWRRRKIKEGDIMKRTVRAFAVATLICAATYERSHAAAIAPLTGIQAGSSNITLVYSPRYRIVVPLTRRYSYQPYWWPQGQYHWSPFGLERWGYWCEGGRGRQINCGVPR